MNALDLWVRPDCIYDREALHRRDTLLFVNPLGFTNMHYSGLLPASNKMLVKDIRCTFFRDGVMVALTGIWFRAIV